MAGQDIKKRIEAGGVTHINVGGDYLFLKFADRPVNVIITGGPSGGSRVTMEAGDKYRPGQFQAFEVENPDADNPAQITFTVGTGDYNRQIVQGEISVEPILRNADGSTKTDTRSNLAIAIMAENLETTAYQTGDVIAQASYLIPGAAVLPDDKDPIIFAGPGGYPVVTWDYNLTNDGGWYQVDWRMNLIDSGPENITNSDAIYNNSSMSDATWTPYHGFLSVRQSHNGIYQQSGVNTKVKVYSAPWLIASLAYIADTDTIILREFNTRAFIEINAQTFATVRQGALPAGVELGGVVRYNTATKQLHFVGNANQVVTYDTLTVVDSYDAGIGLIPGAVVNKNDIYGILETAPTAVLSKVCALPYVTKPEFIGTRPGCELPAVMAMPEALPQITADLTVTELATGIEISGEVIKAAMEYYFRRQVPDDYLDHIYFADLGKDRFGVPLKQIATGNATFDRANINDNFAIMVPGQISLIVDNELTLGAPL